LHGKSVRTGQLRRLADGISEKMLIQQLREMETSRIVRRTVFHEVPPRVEYSATEAGEVLNRALGPIADWGSQYAMGPTQDAPRIDNAYRHVPARIGTRRQRRNSVVAGGIGHPPWAHVMIAATQFIGARSWTLAVAVPNQQESKNDDAD
jgi:DNA-binding HxlR family transcriptional regulator